MSKDDAFSLDSPLPAGAVSGALVPKPKTSIGMSKKLLGGIVLLVVLVLGTFFMAMDKMDQNQVDQKQKATEKADAKKDVLENKGTPTDLKSTQQAGNVARDHATEEPDPAKGTSPGAAAGAGAAGGSAANGKKEFTVPPVGDGKNGGGQQANNIQTPEEMARQRKEDERAKRTAQARAEGLEVKKFDSAGSAGSKNAADMLVDALKGNAQLAALAGVNGNALAQQPQVPQGDQDQKLKFMKDGGNAPTGTHPFGVVEPASPYELHAGSVIPAILLKGINSDLPGLVTAQVRENVYASVNDGALLIPATSKLIGSYDSRIALGQSRQLVVWNMLIFPDGQKLNLAGMPSGDVAGMSGLEADVNNHWLRLFGVTLGMSMVTAGVQLSVPQTGSNSQNGAMNSSQIVTTALAQQFGQLGGQMLGKYLNVQPTLTNQIGERFNLIVPQTINFTAPYRPKRNMM